MSGIGQEKPRNLIAFGAQVRHYRQRVGLSQDQMGEKLHVSGSWIGRIERGEIRCKLDLTKAMDKLLGLGGALVQLWHDLDMAAAFPAWFDWYRVEADCVRLHAYEMAVVYGLLQTEDYARVLLKGDEEAVAARMARQAVLRREDPPPPYVNVLLSELVFHNPVGGKEVMREQIEHLISFTTSERVTVQVIPGMVPPEGNSGAFVIATAADRSELAYVDSAARGLTMADPADLDGLITAHDALRARALPVDMSRDFMIKVMEERWT
ncbi:helix-turn-helix domain-containing protein [Thermomonospora cellulosilytica]|uniref:Transcriptional regulator with XRE-family HTH domain n=1 Tax=Thermomonospora cellulosilytica TaxID=1411118 RepID=A0A7W3MSS2_9ACTN|nr:helix-turn-helix transcriptional regulator [Thermomonospora cellulosilytica]MBA9001222.1 transcriptional regulator with XRE-family HTH domain [Thermomonospora cellulosilytica]